MTPEEPVAVIEHRENDYARIVRLVDVSSIPHGTKLYAADTIAALQAENERLKRDIAVQELFLNEKHEALEALSEFDGNADCWAELKKQRDEARSERDALQRQVEELKRAVEAALLFHSAPFWSDLERARWKELTGHDEATTRILCDTLRAAQPNGPVEPSSA